MKTTTGSVDTIPHPPEINAMARVGHSVRMYLRQQPGPSVELLIDDEDLAPELRTQPESPLS